MTALQVGDRVKVKIDAEGVVTDINGGSASRFIDVQLDGIDERTTYYIPVEYLTKTAPAVKVGDFLDRSAVELPLGSMVLGRYGDRHIVWTHEGSEGKHYNWTPSHYFDPDDWPFILRAQDSVQVLRIGNES